MRQEIAEAKAKWRGLVSEQRFERGGVLQGAWAACLAVLRVEEAEKTPLPSAKSISKPLTHAVVHAALTIFL
jgi:hypothetical protein